LILTGTVFNIVSLFEIFIKLKYWGIVEILSEKIRPRKGKDKS